MAFRNVIRVRAGLSGMSDCILYLPQVYLRDLKKFVCREKILASIRFGAEYSEETALPDHIWPARNTGFDQNTL